MRGAAPFLRAAIAALVLGVPLTACVAPSPGGSAPTTTQPATASESRRPASSAPPPQRRSPPGRAPTVVDSPRRDMRVAYISDGDTFGAAGGQVVRIIGMDTPETKDPDEPVGCYGPQATRRLTRLIGGKVVRVSDQRERHDPYGRRLLDVWTRDGRLVAEVMVRGGFARAMRIWPNVRYSDRLTAAEDRARRRGAGMWGHCRIQ